MDLEKNLIKTTWKMMIVKELRKNELLLKIMVYKFLHLRYSITNQSMADQLIFMVMGMKQDDS